MYSVCTYICFLLEFFLFIQKQMIGFLLVEVTHIIQFYSLIYLRSIFHCCNVDKFRFLYPDEFWLNMFFLQLSNLSPYTHQNSLEILFYISKIFSLRSYIFFRAVVRNFHDFSFQKVKNEFSFFIVFFSRNNMQIYSNMFFFFYHQILNRNYAFF